jgi:hypothetical protein
MNTPWGKSDSIQRFERGLSFVSTPGHGGFAITPQVALKHLSTPAVAKAQKYGSYYFFEEDCDAFIILLEVPTTRNGMTEDKIIDSLSHWHADYLIARGIQPTANGLKFYNDNRLEDRMRADKSPDLIVSANGDWKQGVPKDMVEVTTADGARHFVWASEYAKRNTGLTLLSNFVHVQAVL